MPGRDIFMALMFAMELVIKRNLVYLAWILATIQAGV